MSSLRRLSALSSRSILRQPTASHPPGVERIRPEDDQVMRKILQGTRRELGMAGRAGEVWSNVELESLSQFFSRPGHGYFVARDPEKGVVGGAGFAPTPDGRGRCELRGLYVDRESRGGGVGRKLVLQCLREARGLGYRECFARTRDQMPSARRLYERLGFQLVATPSPNQGQPHYIYRRDLRRPLPSPDISQRERNEVQTVEGEGGKRRDDRGGVLKHAARGKSEHPSAGRQTVAAVRSR